MPEIDWEAIGKEFGERGLDLLKDRLAGVQADLKEFGADIGKDYIRAVRDDLPNLKDELDAQLKALAELHRIETVDVGWEFIGDQLWNLAKLLRVGLLAGGVAL